MAFSPLLTSFKKKNPDGAGIFLALRLLVGVVVLECAAEGADSVSHSLGECWNAGRAEEEDEDDRNNNEFV